MEEIWKDIPGFENCYQVSSFGRVKTLDRCVADRGGERTLLSKILSPQITKSGYARVGLCKNNKRKIKRIHRLVAQVFIPNPDSKPDINHKNGIKTDNRVENLEWCTASENQKHCYRILKRRPNMLGKFGKDNPNSKGVIQIKHGIIIAKFDSAKDAERATGVNQGNISRCARGEGKSAGKYQWEYIK